MNANTAPVAHSATCSCGDTSAHPIVTRTTADGYSLLLWSDGALTDAMGTYCVRGKRGAAQMEAARTAGRAVMHNAGWYNWSEVPAFMARASEVALAHPNLDCIEVCRRATPPSPEQQRAQMEVNSKRWADAVRSHVLHCRDPWCKCDTKAIHKHLA